MGKRLRLVGTAVALVALAVGLMSPAWVHPVTITSSGRSAWKD
jgi:hypothetical protein